MLVFALSALVVLGLTIVAARLIFVLPAAERGTLSRAISASPETALGRAAEENVQDSAIHPLEAGEDAFAARILLARAAERTIDAQYYIWHGDLTGLLLLQALRDAADRGVRVRLLLDDNGIAGLDAVLAGLMAHENVEVRLFNPFVLRRPKPLNYLFDFLRLNRRMHNKSFTVDGAVSIVGGRNVGDEYFAAGTTGDYFDLDVMAVGAIVARVAEQFDRYWASEPVHAAEAVIKAGSADALERAIQGAAQDPRLTSYREAVQRTDFVAALLDRTLDLQPVEITLVGDDPRKGTGRVDEAGLLTTQLDALLGRPGDHVELVSAYFVPGRKGTASLTSLAERGVRVRVLTNSLGATDVVPVHAGYAKYRKELLSGGVELFELKRDRVGAGSDELGRFGSSGASLHAKTFAIDGERLFVGSFNLDPRSALLNTEMGFLIRSERLARELAQRFDRRIPIGAYRVELAPDGDLAWIELLPDGRTIRHTSEPDSSPIKRLAVTVVGWLPVEWLL